MIQLNTAGMWMFAIHLTFLFIKKPVLGYKWHLKDILQSNKILTFSEKYMFGNGHGPKIMEQGSSYININVNLYAYSKLDVKAKFGYAIYASDENHHYDSIELCDGQLPYVNGQNSNYKGIRSVRVGSVSASSQGKIDIYDPILNLNGSYYTYHAIISDKYSVELTAWYNVAFKFCGNGSDEFTSRIDGEVTFKNPYGFIPGELFGMLPFEAARMIAYVLFGMYYFYAYFRYKTSVLPLHHAIVIVYIIALTDSTVWYAVYQDINLTGEPYCCPFPTAVIAALVLQVFRQTFARTLLLVVSLGYGIVRPKLLSAEWVAVTIVTVLYFISALIRLTPISIIKESLIYGPNFVIDVLVITWIYYALGSNIRILTKFQQTYKLQVYTQLSFAIALFVTLFAVVAVILMLDKINVITWPWQAAWMKDILWEVLDFAVLATVCVICMPSENSRHLSYASQIPADDPDEVDVNEVDVNVVDGYVYDTDRPNTWMNITMETLN